MIDLNKYRENIDSIDNKIIQLINKRMEIVKEIGELKRSHQSVIYRPEREKDIIERLFTNNKGLLNKAAIEAIFLEIFAVSRSIELPEKISYLGPVGSFTHQVAESRFGAIGEYVSLKSIKGVFDSVSSGRAVFGVIPVENNQAGSVKETFAHLAERNVSIVAEISEPIHFCLASNEDTVQDIEKIYSKDMAFHQCEQFLEENFGNRVELVAVDSTSHAAELAKDNPQSAALCSLIASKIHQLPVLYYNVEDTENNKTRFLILAKTFQNEKSGNDKTSIILKGSDEPGSLVKILNSFKENNVNLTKIESWPTKEDHRFSYYFFIDFDGHFTDENVQKILNLYPKKIKLLGSYLKNV